MARTQLPDNVYQGTAFLPGALPDGRKGVKTTADTLVNYGAIVAAAADAILSEATSTEVPGAAGTTTYTATLDGTAPQDGAVRPDKVLLNAGGVTYDVLYIAKPVAAGLDPAPRNIVSVVTSAAVVALTIKHYGFDIYGAPMTETHAITATGATKTVTGKKAFAYWWKTDITAAADASTDTVNIGTGNVFGLPYAMTYKNQVIPRVDGAADAATLVVADATTATATTGDVRGTVDFSSDPNGTTTHGVAMWVSDTTSRASTYGIVQA